MIGIDQLVSPRGMASLMTYGAAVANDATSWPTAFQNAFGTSTSAFYAQYPGYRTSLSGSDTCGV